MTDHARHKVAAPDPSPHAVTPGLDQPGQDGPAPDARASDTDRLIRKLMEAQGDHNPLPSTSNPKAGTPKAKGVKHPRRFFKMLRPAPKPAPVANRSLILRGCAYLASKVRFKLANLTRSTAGFKRRKSAPIEVQVFPVAQTKAPSPDIPQAKARPGKVRAQRVRDFKVTSKHLLCAGIALFVVLYPWFLPIVLMLTFWIVLIAYLTLGPDRVNELVVGAWHRLRARRPELAERIRVRADRFANGIDAVLDRLPQSWTGGLYLPDMSGSGPLGGQDDRPDPFDRLSKDGLHG